MTDMCCPVQVFVHVNKQFMSSASVYSALLIPSAPGALRDLAKSQHLGWIINSFMAEQSLLHRLPCILFHVNLKCVECVCAVGSGVAGLCSSLSKGNGSCSWCFKSICLTGVMQSATITCSNITIWSLVDSVRVSLPKPSVNEIVRQPDFAELPIIVEDFLKDHEAVYSGKHAIIDVPAGLGMETVQRHALLIAFGCLLASIPFQLSKPMFHISGAEAC